MLEIQFYNGVNNNILGEEDKLNYYFSILNINKTDSIKEIRIAYYSLSLFLYPDRNKDKDTTKQFQLLATPSKDHEAYTYIKNYIENEKEVEIYKEELYDYYEEDITTFTKIEDISKIGIFLNRKSMKEFEKEFLDEYNFNQNFRERNVNNYIIFVNQKYVGVYNSLCSFVNKCKDTDKVYYMQIK